MNSAFALPESDSKPGTGLYIHTPFCEKKCPYCDFYSLEGQDDLFDIYTNSIINVINNKFSIKTPETVYFGGGTPSLLGAKNLTAILEAIRKTYHLAPDAEITVEVNPGREWGSFFQELALHGLNRVSIGLQSANESELLKLGRRHSVQQVVNTVKAAQNAGIKNLSLDLMLGIPGQTPQSLRESIAFCADLDVHHVSAYLLKIEPGTPFDRQRNLLTLPDEDGVCALYETACEELERRGYRQYEISNFARPGAESRHNLKYWRCEEYLGLGPSAHSFLNGRRFYYPRSLSEFLTDPVPVDDGSGGSAEEYLMLALRLTEGVRFHIYQERFGQPVPPGLLRTASKLAKAGFCAVTDRELYLTRKGFLLSNEVITELLIGSGF